MKEYILPALTCMTAWLSACSVAPPSDVTIFTAETIVTMDSLRPEAEAVAVRQGRIVGVGTQNEMTEIFKGATLNTDYARQTIVPGLIDPHVHMTLGAMMYAIEWVPPWDMPRADGDVAGVPDRADFLAAVTAKNAARDGEAPLILWGYHNLVQGEITRRDLDAIETDRPLILWHYSGHDFYLNSAAIALFELTPDMAKDFEGVGLDANGNLNGRIFEDAVAPLLPKLAPYLLSPSQIGIGFNAFEDLLRQGGVTTVAEMGYGIFGRALEDNYIAAHYSEDDAYRLYKVAEHRAFTKEFGEGAAAKIVEMSADPSVLPQVKLFTDAAFYSQTMKLAAPGYLSGQSAGTDGLWVTEPENLPDVMRPYWEAGLDIHIHSNGDAAQDSTLAAFAQMPDGKPGQRLIIEHAGLLTPVQIARAADLGVGISAASHYVNYMGGDYEIAIGEKAEMITPLRSAIDGGIHTTLHSDAPLAPPLPLVAASKHMTRAMRQGGVQTPAQQLTAEQALRAITLDAAWSLGLDDQLGSIQIGKQADFTILSSNPLKTAAEGWSDIVAKDVMIDGVRK